MTNLLLTARIITNMFFASVDVPADTYVRFETRHPSAPTNSWLARDFAEEQPFARRVTFSDLMQTNVAWYRCVGIRVQQSSRRPSFAKSLPSSTCQRCRDSSRPRSR